LGADQIAELRPPIVEILSAAEDWCVTFAVAGDVSRWVQVTRDSVNCHYPYSESPLSLGHLPEAPDGLVVRDWAPQQYLTFEIQQRQSARALAQFVDLLFQNFLNLRDED